MCKHGLLKILETKKMHIYVQEVKFSQSIQKLLVIYIDVHSEPKVTLFSFPNVLVTSQIFPKNQYFSENSRIVYSKRYSNLLNFSLGDASLAILEGLFSKIFFPVGPNHGGSSYVTKLDLNPPVSNLWRHLCYCDFRIYAISPNCPLLHQ